MDLNEALHDQSRDIFYFGEQHPRPTQADKIKRTVGKVREDESTEPEYDSKRSWEKFSLQSRESGPMALKYSLCKGKRAPDDANKMQAINAEKDQF